MKNIRLFTALILSLIVGSAMAQQYMIVTLADGKTVIYNVEDVRNVTFRTAEEPQVPEFEWVDLGLPSGTAWASCNLGADALVEAGNYYQWGEVTPFNYETSEHYQYQGVSETTLEAEGVINDYGELTPAHDPVTVAYGDGYRMPTTGDLAELKDHCSWEWEEIDGVKCVRFTSIVNCKSIVIPAVGLINGDNGELDMFNELATFWTSTVSGSLCYDFYMTIPEKDNYGYNGGNFINLTSFRKHAHPVRGVRVKNEAPSGSGIFLKGGMNSWSAEKAWEFIEQEQWYYNQWVIDGAIIQAEEEFKFADADWAKINLGCDPGDGLKVNERYILEDGGPNMRLAEDFVGSVTLTLNDDVYSVIFEPHQTGIYLRGGMNGWSAEPEWEFHYTTTPGTYTIENVTIEEGTEFKVASPDWLTINLGYEYDEAIPLNQVVSLSPSGANILMPQTANVDVILTHVGDNYTLELRTR